MFCIPDYFVRARVADAAAYEAWLTSRIMSDPSVSRVDSRLPTNDPSYFSDFFAIC